MLHLLTQASSIHKFLFICKSCVFLKTHLYVKHGYERKFNVVIEKVRINLLRACCDEELKFTVLDETFFMRII